MLIERLREVIDHDTAYRRRSPDAYSLIDQMHQRFSVGRGPVDEQDVIGFVVAMCATGEARRYQAKRQDVAAEKFANDLAVQARERFGESPLQLKFGPSAWFANEPAPNSRQTVPEVSVDY
ncbi:hypothetical protein CIK75_12195 [Glutamicibacter sp. BW78]|nr:hypothetical protein CIK75_12195 [Glutamicibacter sp. BW78]